MRYSWSAQVGFVLSVAAACRSFGEEPEQPSRGGSSSTTAGAAVGGAEGGSHHVVDVSSGRGGVEEHAASGAPTEIAGAPPGGDAAGGFRGIPSSAGATAGNGGGDAGAAGMAEAPAEGGTSSEVALLPYCATGPQGHPVIGPTASTDISAALTYAGAPFVLFMTQPLTQIISLTWNSGPTWYSWACFDAVPKPVRVAAGNGTDLNLQVYALSDKGALSVRQQAASMYRPWQSMPLPETVLARDVAAPSGWLYVASAQGVFARPRPIDETLVTDPGWTKVSDLATTRVAVGSRPDGRHELLTIDEQGHMQKVQESAAGSLQFSGAVSWSEGAEPLVDADFGMNVAGELQAFSVTKSGAILVRTLDAGVWTGWLQVVDGTASFHVKSLAVGTVAGQLPYLFGIGDYELPYYSTNGGLSWGPRF